MTDPTLNPMSLDGRNILITGAGQGIGYGIAEMAIGLGANVAIVERNPETAAKAVETLGADRAAAYVGDVSDEAFVEATVAQAAARFGGIHGLVNGAGITRPSMIEKMTSDQWRAVIDVHLTGAFLFLAAVGRDMLRRARAGDSNPGSIVNILSDAGVQGTIGQVNYAAAKGGLASMAMSAAREWGKYGIRANSVAFGMVETPMTEVIRGEKFRDTYLSRIPLARWSLPAEAAAPVCFLLSDAASYITGQRLSANGGSQMNG
jgi:3-oxoacyl-[acyl-carrier protein] reductase